MKTLNISHLVTKVRTLSIMNTFEYILSDKMTEDENANQYFFRQSFISRCL